MLKLAALPFAAATMLHTERLGAVGLAQQVGSAPEVNLGCQSQPKCKLCFMIEDNPGETTCSSGHWLHHDNRGIVHSKRDQNIKILPNNEIRRIKGGEEYEVKILDDDHDHDDDDTVDGDGKGVAGFRADVPICKSNEVYVQFGSPAEFMQGIFGPIGLGLVTRPIELEHQTACVHDEFVFSVRQVRDDFCHQECTPMPQFNPGFIWQSSGGEAWVTLHRNQAVHLVSNKQDDPATTIMPVPLRTMGIFNDKGAALQHLHEHGYVALDLGLLPSDAKLISQYENKRPAYKGPVDKGDAFREWLQGFLQVDKVEPVSRQAFDAPSGYLHKDTNALKREGSWISTWETSSPINRRMCLQNK